jgi:catechol 2,3-dioxygenase-like lactoylglutathione lyase family enzyme
VKARNNHLCLRVDDLERSIRFYVEALGARQLTPCVPIVGDSADLNFLGRGVRSRYAFIGFDDMYFELVEFEEPRVPTGARPPFEDGFMHYCFTVEDVAGTVERIVAAGGERWPRASSAGPNAGYAVNYAYDPDGNTIQLIDIEVEEVVRNITDRFRSNEDQFSTL